MKNEESFLKQETLKNTEHTIPNINIFPGMSPEVLETLSKEAKALVLSTNAGGGIQDTLLPTIKNVINRGVPVFVLTDNIGSEHGVVRISDEPQVAALEIGITYLEKLNITNTQELYDAINTALNEGINGKNLAKHIQEKFKFSDEEKPITRLGTEKGLEDYKNEVREELGE